MSPVWIGVLIMAAGVALSLLWSARMAMDAGRASGLRGRQAVLSLAILSGVWGLFRGPLAVQVLAGLVLVALALWALMRGDTGRGYSVVQLVFGLFLAAAVPLPWGM